MYYYVRESFSGQNNSEGFAKSVKMVSELEEGQICIDGQSKYDIGYGDHVSMDVKPEYRLKCIKFIL